MCPYRLNVSFQKIKSIDIEDKTCKHRYCPACNEAIVCVRHSQSVPRLRNRQSDASSPSVFVTASKLLLTTAALITYISIGLCVLLALISDFKYIICYVPIPINTNTLDRLFYRSIATYKFGMEDHSQFTLHCNELRRTGCRATDC